MLREYGAREMGHAKDAVNVEGVRCEGDGSCYEYTYSLVPSTITMDSLVTPPLPLTRWPASKASDVCLPPRFEIKCKLFTRPAKIYRAPRISSS